MGIRTSELLLIYLMYLYFKEILYTVTKIISIIRASRFTIFRFFFISNTYTDTSHMVKWTKRIV